MALEEAGVGGLFGEFADGVEVVVDGLMAHAHGDDGDLGGAEVGVGLDGVDPVVWVVGGEGEAGVNGEGVGVAVLVAEVVVEDVGFALEGGRAVAGGDPAVGESGDPAEHDVFAAAHPDRDGLLDGEGVDAGGGDVVPLTMVGDEGVLPELPEHRNLFFDAGATGVKVHAEVLVFEVVPSDADAEGEPAVAEDVEGGGLFGDEDGLALGEYEDAGDEVEVVGCGGGVREQGEGFVERVGVVVDAVPVGGGGFDAEDVVVGEEVGEPEILGGFGEPVDAVGVGFDVGLGERHAEVHTPVSGAVGYTCSATGTPGAGGGAERCCVKGGRGMGGMVRGVAVNVGANTNAPGFRGPIYPDGSFEFVPIPETVATREPVATYADLPLGFEVPTEVAGTPVHLDPTFAEYGPCTEYTYGDPYPVKAGPLLELGAGDQVFFYATLDRHGDDAVGWISDGWGAYVIGRFELARDPIPGAAVSELDAATRAVLWENAHFKREEFDARVLLLGDPDRSRLYGTAVPLSRPTAGVEANQLVLGYSSDSGRGPWWRRPLRFDAEGTRLLIGLEGASDARKHEIATQDE